MCYLPYASTVAKVGDVLGLCKPFVSNVFDKNRLYALYLNDGRCLQIPKNFCFVGEILVGATSTIA